MYTAGNNINMAGYSLLNFTVENLSAAPTANLKPGRLYFDTSANSLRYYDGVNFVLRATDTALFQSNNAAYYLNRTNHTGSQAAATISDLSTVVKAYTLDSFAAPVANVAMNGKVLTGLGTPTAAGMSAEYSWVLNQISSAVSGIRAIKDPVRALFSTNQTLSGVPGTGAADGVSLAAGDPVLLIGQTTGSQNGIWLVQSGGWTRPANWTGSNVEAGTEVLVNEGQTYGGAIYRVSTTGAITVDTTSIAFVQTNKINVYSAGNGLVLTGMVFSVQVVSGGGITVGSSGIAVDTTVVARKFSQAIGDGSATSFTVTHNLNTVDVMVAVRDSSGTIILIEWQATNANAVTVGPFGSAPASGAYRVTVIG